MSRSWFVDDHRHLFEVQRLCELVELPRSTFYAWDTPTLSDTYLDDAWLASEIFDIHTALPGTYGAPRVQGQLRRHGHLVGRKRVARKLFLAGIKDLHDRTVVGWSMGERQTTDLVVNTLVMALARRQPDGDVIHHADGGSQVDPPGCVS